MTAAPTAYRESDVRGASPVRLVVLLYDQMIQDVTRAAQALAENDIGQRTQSINHAILVAGHLQSPLDFARGGKVAEDLDRFYNTLRQNLVHIQFFPSQTGLRQVIIDLLEVREAWLEVERAASAPTVAATAAPVVSMEGSPPDTHLDWKG